MMSLVQLWLLSLVLSAVSLAIMAVLILARLIRERRARKIQARRRAVTAWVLQWMEGGDVERLRVSPGDLRFLADLAGEILALVRGEDRDRLVRFFTAAGVPAFLRRRIRRRSPKLAMLAAETLRHFPGPETRQALLAALDHRKAEVRIVAAISLSQIDAAPPVEDLVERLEIGTREQTRLGLELFRHLAPRQSAALLRIAADESAPLILRGTALAALAGTGDYALVEPMRRLAVSESAEIRAQALHCLASLGHPAARDAVAAGLIDPDWRVREQAAVATGRIGLAELADDLAALLRDEIWWVRFRAGEALLRLREAGIARLRAAAASGTGLEQRSAALVLAENGLSWAEPSEAA